MSSSLPLADFSAEVAASVCQTPHVVLLLVAVALLALVQMLLSLWCGGGNSEPAPSPTSPPTSTKAKKKTQTGAPSIPLPALQNTMELIRCRRSIFPKDMTGGTVPRDILDAMLEAANWAPTHGKTEPWRFCVLDQTGISRMDAIKMRFMSDQLKDPAALEAFVEKGKSKKMENCSHCIVLGMKRVVGAKGKLMPEWEEIAAVACAVQNMHLVLSVHEGVGGYWSSGGWDSWLNCDEMKQLCGLDGDGDRILGLFIMGRSHKHALMRSSRQPWEDKVKWIGEDEKEESQ